MLTPEEKEEVGALTRAIIKKIEGCFDITQDVSEVIKDLCKERVSFKAGEIVVPQDGAYTDVFLIDDGWALRSRHLDNGTRQIVNTVLPGDFLALNAALFTRSDFELRCKTKVDAFRIEGDALNAALSRNAPLSALLFWVNGQEESMLSERIVSLGRRSARQRAAHVMCELVARIEIVDGKSDDDAYVIPLSQDEFADILGISVVHMNKTLQSLHRDKIISFRNTNLKIHDRPQLEIEAGFDKGYLHFTRREDFRNAQRIA